MFIGYNLKIESFFTPATEKYYFNIGKRMYKKYSVQVEENLENLVLKNGNIDGGKMAESWFPQVRADIFLSHSHKNEKLAIAFAGYLNHHFGLITFVDSCIWGYSENLLRLLDNKYCLKKKNSYSYDKRNFTTSAVNMILSTGLNKMIDKCECLFFLNTPSSISIESEVKLATLSPWIYAEVEMTKIIRKKTLSHYRQIRRETKLFSKGNKMLNEAIEFPMSIEHLKVIDSQKILDWKESYNDEEFPLDVLYYLTVDNYLFD